MLHSRRVGGAGKQKRAQFMQALADFLENPVRKLM